VNAYGVWSQVTHNTANTGNVGAFVSSPRTAAASYNVSNLMGYFASSPALGSGSTASSYAAFYADDFSGATNSNIGFRGRMTAAANKWNLYLDGTASNYLAGRTLIGTTTDDGSSKLQVAGAITATGSVGGVNSPNLLPNGSGELGNSLWLSSKLASVQGSNGEGSMWANTTDITTGTYSLDQSNNVPCGAGVPIVLQAELYSAGMTAGSSRVKIEAMDSSNALISEICNVSLGFGSGWTFKSAAAVTPANTAFLRISKIADFSPRATALGCGIRKIKVATGTTPTLYSREANAAYLVDTLNAQTIGGAKSFSGLLTANGGLTTYGTNTMYGGVIELGLTTATMTPFIDFHSSGAANDFDSRIIATAGTAGTTGAGVLTLQAGQVSIYHGTMAQLKLSSGTYAPVIRSNLSNSNIEFVNSANTAVNLNLSDSGALTVRNGIGLTAGDLTINAGYSLILKSGSGYFGYLRADNSSMIGFVNQASNQWNLQIFDGGTVMARGEVQAGNASARLAVDGNVWGAMWGSDWLSNWLATNKMSPRRGGNSKGYVFTDTDNNQTLNWEGSRSRLWIDGSNQGLLWTDAQLSFYGNVFTADTMQQAGFIGGDTQRPYMMQWRGGSAMELMILRPGGARVWSPTRANGYIEWQTDIGAVGTNYFTSDIRKKQNVEPATREALPVIEQIEFSQFEFLPEFNDPTHYDIGLIAQQLQGIEKTFVNEMTDGTLMPNTNVLIPYALKAIKELAARIAKLEGVAA
jgi:hypothetical protein